MAGPNIGKISVTTTTALENKVANYARRIIEARLEKAEPTAINAAKEVIEKYVLDHRVIKAILGRAGALGAGYDLQAEFGLTVPKAKLAVDIILKILAKSANVSVDHTLHKDERGARVDVKINVLNEEDYYDELYNYGDPLNYISRKFIFSSRKRRNVKVGRDYPVDWMKWLLEASQGLSAIIDTLPEIRDFGITYDLLNKDVSRSGRAVMISMKSKSAKTRRLNIPKADGSFPYQFPKAAIPARGAKNFIEEISKDPNFRKEIKDKVTKRLQSALPQTR